VKPVALIGVNFVREQRWPILVLLLWVLVLVFWGLVMPQQHEDLLFVFKQVAIYVVAFSIFFGGSAIYNERKSRRILAVLSKAVSREQYLSGLVLGVTMACGIYCFSLGLTGSWTLGGGFPIHYVWYLMLCLVVACMLAGTVALTFSTFLNPFFAAGATATVLGLPAVVSRMGAHRWEAVIPVYSLAATVLNTEFHAPTPISWRVLGLAVAETVLFWVVAASIFARVDIAVAVE